MDPETKELFDRFTQTQEFLRHSIESHDRQIGEMIERMGDHDRQIGGMIERMEKRDAQTALNFERLTTAMMALTEHTADHKRRIQALEDK